MEANSTKLNLLSFKILNQFAQLENFSTTIQGGISSNTYATFNLSPYSGDILENVDYNKTLLATTLNIHPEKIITSFQTHKDNLLIIDKTFLASTRVEQKERLNGIDALIIQQKNTCIAISAADCVPILLFDPIENVLAAIHAGWRGTVAKLSQKVVTAMIDNFGTNPNNILAGIGPCISQKHFEVGEEVVYQFEKTNLPTEQIIEQNLTTNKNHIDLSLANKIMLTQSGLSPHNIEIANICTYANENLFFSARRQGIKSGRMLTGGILR